MNWTKWGCAVTGKHGPAGHRLLPVKSELNLIDLVVALHKDQDGVAMVNGRRFRCAMRPAFADVVRCRMQETTTALS
jgi:hypothetical protein